MDLQGLPFKLTEEGIRNLKTKRRARFYRRTLILFYVFLGLSLFWVWLYF